MRQGYGSLNLTRVAGGFQCERAEKPRGDGARGGGGVDGAKRCDQEKRRGWGRG